MIKHNDKKELFFVAIVGIIAIFALFLAFFMNQEQTQNDLTGQAWLPENFCDGVGIPSNRMQWAGNQGSMYCYCHPEDPYCDWFGY